MSVGLRFTTEQVLQAVLMSISVLIIFLSPCIIVIRQELRDAQFSRPIAFGICEVTCLYSPNKSVGSLFSGTVCRTLEVTKWMIHALKSLPHKFF